MDPPPSRPRRGRLRALATPANLLALLALAGLVAAVTWLRSHPELNVFSSEGLREAVDRLGPWGPIAYVAAVALAVVVSQIPGVPMAMAAGALWGPWAAGLYSVAGAFAGGMIAYAIGRTLGRGAMRALTGRAVAFRSERGERFVLIVIGVSRALPVLSFDVISYAAGVSGVRALPYALVTLIGMIPSTFLLTWLGSSFALDMRVGLALSLVAGALLVALPWWVRRTNWLGLRDAIAFE